MDIGGLFWNSMVLGITVVIFLVLEVWRRKNRCRLPPGPAGWPIVGNLLQLGNKPNESFFHLATKYGPLMTLSLGMKTTVVVSSSAMAKEVLKTHDRIFAGRIITQASKALSFYKNSMFLCQYGSHWRMLRRISNTELFSEKRLEALQHLRRDQAKRMVHQIFQDAAKEKCVDIGHAAFQTSFNLLGNMVFGKDVFDPQFSGASQELKDTLSKLTEIHASPNLADFFPCLQWLDLQRVYRNAGIYMKKDILTAGSETTATTIEWAMAELISNPEKMKRVQAELENVVGRKRMVEESDAERLPYLRAVMKEVFRLHPAAPFLVPHRADNRCEIAGFVIPKHTQIIINVWAIGRDPSMWNEPSKFIPERFLDKEMSSVEYRGQNFELIPFGAGRRMCVGLPLASRMVHLLLASLLHSFDWALPEGMSAEQLDMADKFGMTLSTAVPLKAIPMPRLPSEMSLNLAFVPREIY